MKVISNTFPEYFNVPHGKPGELCHWVQDKCYNLVRDNDDKIIFFTKPIDSHGVLANGGKPPKLTGVLAEVKWEGWRLIIE